MTWELEFTVKQIFLFQKFLIAAHAQGSYAKVPVISAQLRRFTYITVPSVTY